MEISLSHYVSSYLCLYFTQRCRLFLDHPRRSCLSATLDRKKDISILTLDIKAYYHSIEFDFEAIDETSYLKELNQSSSQMLENLLVKVHQEYKSRILETGHPQVTTEANRYPLPIGLLSSLILANYFLKDFDQLISDISPEYYGRYVDDIILVLNDQTSKEGTTNRLRDLVRERLVDILQEDSQGDQVKDLKQYRFTLPKYTNLLLQQDKMFLYEFSHKSPPSILNVMIEEQKQRSSEYRFLSDILDETFTDFESVVFESSFDFDDGNRAKFKEVNEDKFKLASFLAKFIQKSIENGPEYRKAEVDKIFKFFKGRYYIKHYYFWEKLLTLFWIRKEYKLFDRVVREIDGAIKRVKVSRHWTISAQEIKNSLSDYLDCSIGLAVNLNPSNNDFYGDYIDQK
ncbi:MAG: RNA-directed DNA polymerase [Saprospiraceae bacterium]|nr:RNA-directed DNA polymerase [Saprospiraceae bacterium]